LAGYDFDEKSVRVARCLNLIAGDGQTNVLHLSTLDYSKWDERAKQDSDWIDTYGPGWKKLKKQRAKRNLDFLKPGGRMAIVLPQGRFNNATDARVRRYIAERGRILAVECRYAASACRRAKTAKLRATTEDQT
jgi:type I restriction enzyme M protein